MNALLTVEQVAVLLDAHRSLFMDSATSLGISLDNAERRLERFERVELEDAGYALPPERPPP